MDNSQNPENIQLVQEPVKCLRCQHVFKNMLIHEIGGIRGLMSGDTLISQGVMTCAGCGWVFFFTMSVSDVDRFTKLIEQFAGKDPDNPPS